MLDGTFPAQPPKLFFHSWTDNYGPVNPNLYEVSHQPSHMLAPANASIEFVCFAGTVILEAS